ncbi:MAG: sulfite reductase subunit alpha [Verrucomicrobiales bacterium]|nr:sulfite reductase subunit alpha [Verrucomicrobiales bacterium]
MSIAVPKIPENAPFSPIQRNWLDGYIAALQSGSASGSADSTKEKVLVIYASQSGNSETLAEEFGSQLSSAGFSPRVVCAEDFEPGNLVNEKYLLLVTSTWGEGDPPDNAVDFWGGLSSDEQPRLENLKFSVLGLGDSNYIDFCGMGKKFDARLEELGANRLCPRGDCDTDFEETAAAWFAMFQDKLGAKASSLQTAVVTEGYSKKNPFPAQLIANRRLNGDSSERDTRHFEISLAGSGMSYEVGDVLGVYPENDPELVDEILKVLNLEVTDEEREQLVTDYDVCSISAKFLESWNALSEAPLNLTEDETRDYLASHQLIDLIEDVPVTLTSLDQLTEGLRKLGPRLYSISSSPKAHVDEVHLTVARVEYETFGKVKKGVCSNYLSDRVSEECKVRVFLQQVKHFKLPEDGNVPVIMVGPGTGIAPFRAFLEERAATGSAGGNWLFFGNPHESTDWLYREEFESMQECGVLTHYSTAWSRDQEIKVYVQDRIRESGEELWKWIGEQGAHFYVCGDAKRMAKDVEDALRFVIAEYGKMDLEAADDYIAKLKKEKRYQRDVY